MVEQKVIHVGDGVDSVTILFGRDNRPPIPKVISPVNHAVHSLKHKCFRCSHTFFEKDMFPVTLPDSIEWFCMLCRSCSTRGFDTV